MAAFVGTNLFRKLPKSLINTRLTGLLMVISRPASLEAGNVSQAFQGPHYPVKKMATVLSCALVLSSLSLSAQAQWEPHQNIIDTAVSYLQSLPPAHPAQTRTEVTPGSLDRRLKLSQCNTPLSADLSNKQALGRVSVEVSCSDKKSWKIRIPATVSVYVPVAITQKPVPRRKQLLKSDVFYEERDISKLFKGYYTKNDDINGLIARVQIKANTPLSPGLVQPPKMVKRGQNIDLFVKTRSYEIHSEGKALSDGARGDVIRVKNNRSSRIVEGTVVGPGIVQIGHHASP